MVEREGKMARWALRGALVIVAIGVWGAVAWRLANTGEPAGGGRSSERAAPPAAEGRLSQRYSPGDRDPFAALVALDVPASTSRPGVNTSGSLGEPEPITEERSPGPPAGSGRAALDYSRSARSGGTGFDDAYTVPSAPDPSLAEPEWFVIGIVGEAALLEGPSGAVTVVREGDVIGAFEVAKVSDQFVTVVQGERAFLLALE